MDGLRTFYVVYLLLCGWFKVDCRILLAHVSPFWCYFHVRITCYGVLNFVNICMLDILTCMVIVDKFG